MFSTQHTGSSGMGCRELSKIRVILINLDVTRERGLNSVRVIVFEHFTGYVALKKMHLLSILRLSRFPRAPQTDTAR